MVFPGSWQSRARQGRFAPRVTVASHLSTQPSDYQGFGAGAEGPFSAHLLSKPPGSTPFFGSFATALWCPASTSKKGGAEGCLCALPEARSEAGLLLTRNAASFSNTHFKRKLGGKGGMYKNKKHKVTEGFALRKSSHTGHAANRQKNSALAALLLLRPQGAQAV